MNNTFIQKKELISKESDTSACYVATENAKLNNFRTNLNRKNTISY